MLFTCVTSLNSHNISMKERLLSNFTNRKQRPREVCLLKSYRNRDKMDLTDFLISFFGFYGNSFGHGHIGFPVLVEIEVMEEACTEMITFSFWKSPRESSEPFLSSTQA